MAERLEGSEGGQWEKVQDLLDQAGVAIPLMAFRVVAGIDSEGKRTSTWHCHFDDGTVTAGDMFGLVTVSIQEWLHDHLHSLEEG